MVPGNPRVYHFDPVFLIRPVDLNGLEGWIRAITPIIAAIQRESGVHRCPMFQKGEAYFADWRDRKGKRKRKSFETPESAIAYEDAQKAVARPKPNRAAVSRSLRPSLVSSPRPSKTVMQHGPQKPSSASAGHSRQANSRQTTSKRSTSQSPPASHLLSATGKQRRSSVSSSTLRSITGQQTSRISSYVRPCRAQETSPPPQRKGCKS